MKMMKVKEGKFDKVFDRLVEFLRRTPTQNFHVRETIAWTNDVGGQDLRRHDVHLYAQGVRHGFVILADHNMDNTLTGPFEVARVYQD